MATFDSVLTRDSNGHHGVSVGDADGDGLDDLYVAQPAGLPNRLYRNRGDSTFEDITDKAGLGVLDDTAQSTLRRRRQRRRSGSRACDGDAARFCSSTTARARFAIVPDAFGSPAAPGRADVDLDGGLRPRRLPRSVSLRLLVFLRRRRGQGRNAGAVLRRAQRAAGRPLPQRRPRALRRGHRGGGLDAGNDRYHFAAAWADYDEDGWPDLLVANDFGTKNLYRNLGAATGRVTFEDVAAAAGVLDHGAGMSATFLDYDNDGRLDIYTGNMWSAPACASPRRRRSCRTRRRRCAASIAATSAATRCSGTRATDASRTRRSTRTPRWAAGRGRPTRSTSTTTAGTTSTSSTACSRARAQAPRQARRTTSKGSSGGRSSRTRRSRACKGTPYDDAWRAINQLLIHGSIASRQRNVFLRNDGQGGFDDVSGAVGLDLDQDGRSFARARRRSRRRSGPRVMAARQAPQLRVFRNDFASKATVARGQARGHEEQPRCDRRARDRRDRSPAPDEDRPGRLRIPVAALEGAAVRSGSESADREADGRLAVGHDSGLHRRAAEHARPDRRRADDYQRSRSRRSRRQRAVDRRRRRASRRVPTRHRSDVDVRAVSGARLLAPGPGRTDAIARGARRAAGGRAALVVPREPRRARRSTRSRAATAALTQAGVAALAVAVDTPPTRRVCESAPPASLPVVVASREVGLSYAILNRHLFMNRQDLRLPTGLLLDRGGQRREGVPRRVDVRAIVQDATTIDATPAERLVASGAVPGHVLLSAAAAQLPAVRTRAARSGTRGAPRSSRSSAPRRRTRARPRSIAWARCSRRAGETDARARGVRARARAAARPGRSQQRSRRAARAGRRSRRRPSSASAPRSRRRPTTPMR